MSKIWDLGQFVGKTALQDDSGNTLSYEDLDTESGKLAETIGRRCLVFCLCRNEIGSVLGYVSFINHGIVSVMVNAHLEEELLANLLATYSPEYLWMPADMTEKFSGMKAVFEAHDYALLETGYEKKYPLYEDL